jgi:hypothetical protein
MFEMSRTERFIKKIEINQDIKQFNNFLTTI